MPKKQTDWEERATYFAQALFDVMDGMDDHDIQGYTGHTMQNCERIAKARADAAQLLRERPVTVE